MNTRVRRSRVVRWLRWLAVIVGVLLLALSLFIVTFDINSYRDTLQTVASRALNRDVELTGELAMGISLVPTVVAKDVRIGNPDWASRRYFAAVDKLELKVELLPLLIKQFRITQLLLQGADIELESDRQGHSNWIFSNVQKRIEWGGFSGIRRVRIRQSKLVYRHTGAGVKPVTIQQADAVLRLDLPVELALKGEYAGQPIDLKLTGNRLDDLIGSQQPWQFTSEAHVGDARLDLKGVVEILEQAWVVNAGVVLQGEQSKVMESLLGRPLPKFGPYQISLQLQADGEQVRASSVRMDMELPLNGRQIRITEGSGSWGAHAPLQLSLAGEYADQSVDITLNAGTLQAMLSATESWPLQGVLTAAQNRLDVNGEIAGLLGANRLDLQLAMQGENVRLLEPMLAMKLPKIGNYQITAGLKGEGGQYVAEIAAARVGSSDMRGRLSFDLRETPPRVAVDLTSKTLSLEDFTGRSRKPAKRGSEDSALAQSLLWALPGNVELDLQLKAGRVLGLPQLTRNVAVKGQLSNGRLRLVPVVATIAAGRLSASVDILPGKQQTEVAIELASNKLNIGKLFQNGRGGQGVKGDLKGVTLKLNGKGARLDELLQQARFEVRAAALDLPIFGEGEADPIAFTDIKVHAAAGKPVRLEAQGRVRKVPVTIELATDQLLGLINGTKPLPISLVASIADNRLWATGTLKDLTHPEGIKLDVKLKGQQLKSLEPLFNVNLLPMGAYKLNGQLAGGKGEYRVTSLMGQINRSDFKGKVMLNTTGERPLITADLQSGILYYQDIFTREPSSTQSQASAYVIPDVRMPERLQRMIDISLTFNAKRLFMGEVEYTGLNLQAELSDGKLEMSPISASLMGVKIDSALKVKSTNEVLVVALRLEASSVNYGALLKSLGVSERFEGVADLNLDITGEGHSLRQLLSMANGHINVVAGKGRINQSKLDLWAAPLIASMLTSAWKTDAHTEVNCAVGRFDIINGVASSDTILLDTSRITIAGSGSLNLANETLNILLVPSPKIPSFISLANPARITGTLAEPKVATESALRKGWFLGGLLMGLANPASLLLMYGKLGTLEENPCEEAVKQREDKEAQAKDQGNLNLLNKP
ncbi:MAG: AsmA family protein [Amphritea sp.]